jgi:CheY-like chemotaxis protein
MAASLQGLTILIVDDEPLVRSVFRRTLARQGATVFDAALVSGAQALLQERPFDLVISDYRMPGATGADLIAWIRPRWPALPIIILSGYPEEAGDVDAELILAKPLGQDAFLQAVLSVIATRSSIERVAAAIRPIP